MYVFFWKVFLEIGSAGFYTVKFIHVCSKITAPAATFFFLGGGPGAPHKFDILIYTEG